MQEHEFHIIFHRFLILFRPGRHFCLRAAVDNGHIFHSGNPFGGAGTVHRGVTGTDNGNMFAHFQRCVVVVIMQERQGFIDVTVIPGEFHAAVFICPDPDQHIGETLLHQLIDGQTRVTAVFKFHAVVGDELNIVLNGFTRDTEVRDDIRHHTTGIGFFLKYRHRMTGTGEEIPGRQTRRTGTNHRHRIFITGTGRFVPAGFVLFPAFFHRHFFQFADIQRAFVIQTGTVVLALVITDMTGDSRQGVALVNQFQRIRIASFAQQTDILRDILFDGTGGHTRCDIAVGQRQRAARIDFLI